MDIGSLSHPGGEVPVVHTFTDLSESWHAKAHVGSRIELIDVDQCAYVNYLTVFKPEDLVYAGWHKRDAASDGHGWYSGSVKEGNHLWHLRKDHPVEDFMLIIYAGHDNKEDAEELEYSTIKHLWDTVGKHKDGGRCLNLARYSKHFHFDSTGVKHSEEAKAKLSKVKSGENNPLFGKFGADHPGSKPVIELVSGTVYAGGREAAREKGVAQPTISLSCNTSRNKLIKGEQLTASSLRTNRLGKPNPNIGNCWLLLEDFQRELAAGRSVEVFSKVQS